MRVEETDAPVNEDHMVAAPAYDGPQDRSEWNETGEDAWYDSGFDDE